ncbi:MAG: hypothetical protein RIR01_2276 [Bacteroidota bacterium]|jgi:hypothetical protein
MKELNDNELLNESNFYEGVNNLFLSPSALKMLLETPAKYYDYYVLGNKEKKSAKFFDEGTLVHALVLEPDTVNEKFVKMGISTPSDSTKACLDHLLSLERNASELEEYTEEIIDYLKEINLHQSLVDDKKPGKDGKMYTGDEKRIAKIINENSCEYFKLMVEGRDKVIVDAAMWDRCYAKAEEILKHPYVKRLLEETPTDEIRTELELSAKIEDVKYGIKGILDIIKVDKTEKKIYVADLKTSSGNLKAFPDSVEKYGYWLQGAIYSALAKSLAVGGAMNYSVEVSFIVIDNNNQVYPFVVTEKSLVEWRIRMYELINKEIDYHITNKDFTLPYEYANNLITL